MKETITNLKSNEQIVILTNRKDITADYVILELSKRGIPFYRFNTEDFPHTVKLSFKLQRNFNEALIIAKNIKLSLNDVKSIWYRRPVIPSFDHIDLEAGIKDFCVKESYYSLEGVWASLDCFWVSNPFNIRKAENKPFQLKAASETGFQIPETLISNDPDSIESFFEKNDREIIIKPVRTGVFKEKEKEKIIFTSRIGPNDIDKIDSSIPIPSIFQRKIPKKYDIRVTVIGEEVFATEIHSQSYAESTVDWRRGENPRIVHKKHKLPDHVEAQCQFLTKSLGLQFAAIDLVLTPSEEYYFLEINPNGQWAWIEERTGFKLTNALVDLLLCGKR